MTSERFPLDPILVSILKTKERDGSTLNEIREDFADLTGRDLPFEYDENLEIYLNFVDGVYPVTQPQGTKFWYYKEKPVESVPASIASSSSASTSSSLGIKPAITQKRGFANVAVSYQDYLRIPENDYPLGKTMHFRVKNLAIGLGFQGVESERAKRIDPENTPKLISYNLIGDDFLLTVARYEMDCQLEPFRRVHKSGLCVSGQTIREAAEQILKLPREEDVIINVGSVDLLHGRSYYELYSDLLYLIKCCHLRDINPIMTTLVSIGNQMHNKALCTNLLKFNETIRNCGYDYIDLYECLIQDGKLLTSCFKYETNKVTGSSQPFLLWNKLGRQRALKYLQTELMNILSY